jgi:thioredoxin reductase (NADPH)
MLERRLPEKQLMKKTDYDLAIIGGGSGGLTAGMYGGAARLNTLLIERAALGGQILVTDWIKNYPGFPEGVTGVELVKKMTEQAKKFGLSFESNDIIALDLSGLVKYNRLKDKTVSARAVIIATGASPSKLGIPGEKRLLGKGISSCATCDGPF